MATLEEYNKARKIISMALKSEGVSVIPFQGDNAIHLNDEAYEAYYTQNVDGVTIKGKAEAIEAALQAKGFYLDPYWSNTLILERI